MDEQWTADSRQWTDSGGQTVDSGLTVADRQWMDNGGPTVGGRLTADSSDSVMVATHMLAACRLRGGEVSNSLQRARERSRSQTGARSKRNKNPVAIQ